MVPCTIVCTSPDAGGAPLSAGGPPPIGGIPPAALAPLTAKGARLAACDLLPTSDAFNAAHARREQHARAPFTKGEKPAFHTPLDNFAKLRLWQLPYERVVFLDADTIVLKPLDRLFDYPEFSAAPNVYETLADFRRLNSGVFTARPSPATFTRMLARLDTPGAFWKRTGQTFLEAFFPDWQGLPVYENLLQYVWLNLPELWDWSLARVVHFQCEKPWDPANPKRHRLAPLVDGDHDWRGGNVLDQAGEERLALVDGIVPASQCLVHGDELQPDELEPARFQPAEYRAHQAALHGVGLDDDQRALHAHPPLAPPVYTLAGSPINSVQVSMPWAMIP